MTPIEFAKKHGLEVASEGEGNIRDISGIYCCDPVSYTHLDVYKRQT